MRIATWNVNSVNARLETVLDFFREETPDVACLQEIKCVDEEVPPREPFESLGYNVETHTARRPITAWPLLSKFPLSDVRRGLPGDESDEQSRYLEALVEAPRPVRVASIYLPNGNPIVTEKFDSQRRWMGRLRAHEFSLLALVEPLVLAGDYNVIPRARRLRQPGVVDERRPVCPVQPESRAAWRALRNLGLVEAHAAAGEPAGTYTFWDYQAGAWQKNHGIRIDHAFLSPQAGDKLASITTHREMRAREKPSDHVPVTVELNLA